MLFKYCNLYLLDNYIRLFTDSATKIQSVSKQKMTYILQYYDKIEQKIYIIIFSFVKFYHKIV